MRGSWLRRPPSRGSSCRTTPRAPWADRAARRPAPADRRWGWAVGVGFEVGPVERRVFSDRVQRGQVHVVVDVKGRGKKRIDCRIHLRTVRSSASPPPPPSRQRVLPEPLWRVASDRRRWRELAARPHVRSPFGLARLCGSRHSAPAPLAALLSLALGLRPQPDAEVQRRNRVVAIPDSSPCVRQADANR